MGTSNRPNFTRYQGPQVRVLIIPGLKGSGPEHWQSWLQTQYSDAVRVKQADWLTPDLEAWSAQIDSTIQRHSPEVHWVAVAHSFGCLALAHHLTRQQAQRTQHAAQQHAGVAAALLVAPADPQKFEVSPLLPQHKIAIPSLLIGSENDPWMPLDRARQWADRWGSTFLNLGQAGHINIESGFGPWPLARIKVDQLVRRQQLKLRMGQPWTPVQEESLYPLGTAKAFTHTNHKTPERTSP